MNRVVVLAPNWLGDAIMALPAIGALRRWYPRAHLAVAARAAVAPVLSMAAGVDEVIALAGRGAWRDGAGRRADAARIAQGRFDAGLLLPNSFHAAWLLRRAGVPERWGYRRDLRGLLLTRGVARPPGRVTQAGYYAALVTALGGPEADMTASLTVAPRDRERANDLLRSHGWAGGPLIGFAPGAAFGPAKRWPPDRVAAVASQLARQTGAAPVFVGAAGDLGTIAQVLAAYARAGSAPAAIDLGGRTDLPVLAGVLAACAAVLSNDSGTMHLAAAIGVPVTGIYGPTDERATAPLPHPAAVPAAIVAGTAWCRPCQLRHCPIDHRCMTSIAPARVAAVVAATMRGAVPGATPAPQAEEPS